MKNYIYDFQYLTGLIGGSINIEDKYGMRNGPSIDSF